MSPRGLRAPRGRGPALFGREGVGGDGRRQAGGAARVVDGGERLRARGGAGGGQGVRSL